MKIGLIDIQISNGQNDSMPETDHILTHGERSLRVLKAAYKSHSGKKLTCGQFVWFSIPQYGGVYLHLLRAVDALITQQVNIICLPMGFLKPSPVLKSLVKACVQNEILLVSPSGNHGPDKITYPAAYPNVLCVGAVDPLGIVETYSGSLKDEQGRSNKPEVLEEGSFVDDFKLITKGTSIACAKVAGLAAALLDKNPKASSSQLRGLICLNSRPALGSYYGLVDGKKAMEAVHGEYVDSAGIEKPNQESFESGWIDWSLEAESKRATRNSRTVEGLISMRETVKEYTLKVLKNEPSVRALESFEHFNVIYLNAPMAVFENLFRHPDLLWASAADVNYFDLISA